MGEKESELRRFVADLKPDEIMYLLYTKEVRKQFLFPYYSTYT
ncbi:MAG: hypothetical protein Q8R37_05540 [Nanoarchaeota archaeon]|nr:hypothetical protein [Nanoarchaeota archaeon]